MEKDPTLRVPKQDIDSPDSSEEVGVEVISASTAALSQPHTFRSYHQEYLESPWLGSKVGPKMWRFYALRWLATYPLQRRLPFLLPFHTTMTYGEVLVLSLIALITGANFASNSLGFTGELSSMFMANCFVTAMHNNAWTFFLGIPFDRALMMHKASAWAAIITSVWHGVVSHSMNASGLGLTFLVCCMVVMSIWIVRRKTFEVFMYAHWVLFALVGLISVIHGAAIAAVGLVIWFVEALLHNIVFPRLRTPRRARFTALPGNVVRMCFTQDPNNWFHYRGGQFVFLCIPKLGYFQWHPFSISSAPHEKDVMIHIRALGDWTERLYELVRNNPGEYNVIIDGPYGTPTLDLDSSRYQIVLLVSGGIGITPMQSICKDLLHLSDHGRPMKKIWFVWSVRDRETLSTMFSHTHKAGELETPRHSVLNGSLPGPFAPSDVMPRRASLKFEEDYESHKVKHVESVHSSVLHTEFYLTQARNQAELSSMQMHPDIQSVLKFGRPDWTRIFSGCKLLASDMKEKRVAVLVCGPNPLVDEVLAFSRKYSDSQVKFDVHCDLFEF